MNHGMACGYHDSNLADLHQKIRTKAVFCYNRKSVSNFGKCFLFNQ